MYFFYSFSTASNYMDSAECALSFTESRNCMVKTYIATYSPVP